MTTLLVFIGSILLLVGIHEGGHFLAAKALGMAVEEFAIGFGPPLWRRRRGETLYSVRLLPLGGFVRLAGEPGSSLEVPPDRTYHGRPAWARFLLSASGPAANVLLALMILLAATWSLGIPRVQVAGLVPDMPAQDSLQAGDHVLAIGDRSIWFPEDVGPAIQAAAPDPVRLELMRGGERVTVTVEPVYSDEAELYRLGAYFGTWAALTEVIDLEPDAPLAMAGLQSGDRIVEVCGAPVGTLHELVGVIHDRGCGQFTVERAGTRIDLDLPDDPLAALSAGVEFAELPAVHVRPGAAGVPLAFRQLGSVLVGFVEGIRALVTQEVPAGEAVAGPVGIAGILSQGIQAGAWATLMLVALLSLNLAIINLLPFPALDGARMTFALWEMITRRRVSPAVENAIHTVGFLLLIAGLLLITFWDVLRLVR